MVRSSGTLVRTDYKHKECRLPLSWAVGSGQKAVVKLLLVKDDVDPDSKDKGGRTPLLWATRNGHEAVVKLLIPMELVPRCFIRISII